MGSSFTLMNNTDTVVYVQSGIDWGIFGAVLIAVATVVLVVVTVISGGAIGGMAAGVGPAITAAFGERVSNMIVVAIIIWLGWGPALGGTAVGITAMAVGLNMKEKAHYSDLELKELAEMQKSAQDMIKGFERIDPGKYYKFSGTLSLARHVTLLYDDGQAVQKTLWTGATAGSNREYKVLDKEFATSQLMGCWVDADSSKPQTFLGKDGVTRTLSTRLMETRKDDIYWKETCLSHCRGYEFYGIENKVECWCSNNMNFLDAEFMKTRITFIDECRKDGYGGKWRLAVHKITPSPHYLQNFNWERQQQTARRLELGDDASDADLLRVLGAQRGELVKDLDEYNNRNNGSLTSAELAMDHRRLPAEKQDLIIFEALEKPDHDIATRRLEGQHDHEATGVRLAQWTTQCEDATFPDASHCDRLLERQCGACIPCEICLEDNSYPMCRSECLRCDHCAQYPVCLAVAHHCGPEDKVKHAMENCDVDEQDCSELQHIMKCVSEKIFE